MMLPISLLLGLFVMAGCAPGEQPPIATPETLTIARATDVTGLDPGQVYDTESAQVTEQIFEHLVRLLPEGRGVEPGLATSWDVSPDGTVWTFHLRSGVVFHDGTPFDADAVVFSFKWQKNAEVLRYFRNVKEVVAVDPLTVRFTLHHAYAPFLAYLGTYVAAIVSPTSAKKYGREFAQHPVGTGPFRFSSWVPGKSVIVERSESYWGARPALRRVVFRMIADARERLQAIESGAVDVATDVLPEDAPVAALHPDLKVLGFPEHDLAYVALNTSRPPFDDVRVRRAANHAVNRDALVNLIYQGSATSATGPIPPEMWSYNGDIDQYKYDPDLGRRLVTTSNLRPARLKFHVFDSPRTYLPNPVEEARMIQQNLAEVGIATDLVVQDVATFLSSVRSGKHDLCLVGWYADTDDPENFLYTLLDSDNAQVGSADNFAFYRNREYDALMLAAEREQQRERRETLYRRAQEIVAKEAPWIPLAHVPRVVLVRNGVEGLQFTTQGEPDFLAVRIDERR